MYFQCRNSHFQQRIGRCSNNELKYDKNEQCFDIVSKRMKISAEKRQLQQQPKNDLKNIGESKIQTTSELNRILHCEVVKVKPIDSIHEAKFTDEIHRVMKTRYRETYKSQAYAW